MSAQTKAVHRIAQWNEGELAQLLLACKVS